MSRSVMCVITRHGVGEAISGDKEGQDHAAVRWEATLARQEKHQAQEETLQDGILLSSTLVPLKFCSAAHFVAEVVSIAVNRNHGWCTSVN
ncbi:50S ribosomal protein L35 [Zea mays]|jgi:hypothetical protein|uniref:50S ribosomal protein L35 n=1 Tax=Zea mays TaxID=4577 RepID=A0A1D6JJM2_MAIZE|nr:50S ribosomal protein L35 [Zea mays]